MDKSFDASLGEVISNDPSVVAYQTFDYNNDDKSALKKYRTEFWQGQTFPEISMDGIRYLQVIRQKPDA